MAILNDSTVEVKRTFNAPAETVFKAISEGILLRCCGANPESIKIDFQVGGAWSVLFMSKYPMNGTYTRIVQNKEIGFTWSEGGEVLITLDEKNGATKMHLKHVNIPTAALAKDIDGGWRDGVNDFSPHVGRTIKISRDLSAPLNQVFELCASPKFFLNVGAKAGQGSHDFRVGGKYSYQVSCGGTPFILEGEYTDIRPGKRIAFTWNDNDTKIPSGETLVLLDFVEKDKNTTTLTLTHTGFASDKSAKSHEEGWTEILGDFMKNA